ncbi:hypothetical protein [Clostridium sp.]|uniref:hypothetical protein n=1 Tax=Clostridium sp. TaxID=1506 RepID=UPI003F3B2B83
MNEFNKIRNKYSSFKKIENDPSKQLEKDVLVLEIEMLRAKVTDEKYQRDCNRIIADILI